MKKKVLFYLAENKLSPKGGPFAVGFYYKMEQEKRKDDLFSFLPPEKPKRPLLYKFESIFRSLLPKTIFNKYWLRKTILFRKNFLLGKSIQPPVNLSSYDVIFFHETTEMYKIRDALDNYKGIIILQSHSPIPRGQEICSDTEPEVKQAIPNFEELYENVDRYAFDRADYIIFPCEEAEQPYEEFWTYFKKIQQQKKDKSFKYILTGIPSITAKGDNEATRKKYGIPQDAFLISYLGRHNFVKGYDILKKIVERYFELNANAWLIAAGNEYPFSRLNHYRWKEIGFTNEPHTIIEASDVFLLPNRVTYFDIVMLEILSLGKIVIASRTGGNKFFEKNKVEGVFLYDNIEEAIHLLDYVSSMSAQERKALGRTNRTFFESNLTVESMYDDYKSKIQEIIENDKDKTRT